MTLEVADVHAHVQRLVSAVKTETMLPTEEQYTVVHFFCGQKEAKHIHKEIFPVYSRKCLSCKVVHNWVDKFSQGHSKVTDDAQPGVEVAVITVKIFLCCGF
jgi:hypothetical protein